MTLIAFIIFAISHAALIVLFEKQRKQIDHLKSLNFKMWRKNLRLEKTVKQQESELRMLASDFRK